MRNSSASCSSSTWSRASTAANLRQAKATGPRLRLPLRGWLDAAQSALNAPDERRGDACRASGCVGRAWANAMSGEQLVTFVRDEVFPFFAGVSATPLAWASWRRRVCPSTSRPCWPRVVTLVNELRLEQADPDTKGDLFEHVLRQIKQAGELGQFRTPRHVIRAIVDLVDPKIGETVYDPCRRHRRVPSGGLWAYPPRQLFGQWPRRGRTGGQNLRARLMATGWTPPNGASCKTATFYGNDVDPKMVSLASHEPRPARPARCKNP